MSAGPAPRQRPLPAPAHPVTIDLTAAIVAVWNETPHVLTVDHGGARESAGLPFGPFDPLSHRTLDSGLRSWVGEQTGVELGYAEQLYTFGDRGRHEIRPGEGPRVVSVGYLALTRAASPEPPMPQTAWRGWYAFFPWEDWRAQKPAIIDAVVVPQLKRFIAAAPDATARERRADRVRLTFGLDGIPFDEERTLERYELLYEAGLIAEAVRDGRTAAKDVPPGALGQSMIFDHRRILATAMGRLRGKLKYRPLIFELMPPLFTLLELQRTVEAISGIRLHKQNFRRLVEGQGLVEGTGRTSAQGKGRPAEQFRFRREVLRERPAPGVKLSGLKRR